MFSICFPLFSTCFPMSPLCFSCLHKFSHVSTLFSMFSTLFSHVYTMFSPCFHMFSHVFHFYLTLIHQSNFDRGLSRGVSANRRQGTQVARPAIRNDNSGSQESRVHRRTICPRPGLVILLPRPIILVLVVVEVATVVVAAVGRRSGIESRRVSTPGLEVRVAQAGVIAGSDVVHDALESPASPPEPTAGLVEVRRRRAILLVPGERPLTPIDEEGVPSQR